MDQNNYFQWCKCSCHHDTPTVSYSECKALQSPDLGPPFWIPPLLETLWSLLRCNRLGRKGTAFILVVAILPPWPAAEQVLTTIESVSRGEARQYWQQLQLQSVLTESGASEQAQTTGLDRKAVVTVRKRLHFHSCPFCYSKGNNKLGDFVKVTEEINVRIGISLSLILFPKSCAFV